MLKPIHILDFDGSVTSQPELQRRFQSRIAIQGLRRYEYAARLWTSPSIFKRICQRSFHGLPAGFSFIGSGDYHHYSLGLISEYQTPLTVVIFDNHPDWMKPPHQYHCGTWVYSLARLAHVKRIIIVGLESGDINQDHFKDGDVDSFRQEKIVLLPYQPVEATIPNQGTRTLASKLGQSLEEGIEELLHWINTPQVYVSVDKDCLRLEDAYTNWEQGTLPLSHVTACIRAIAQQHTIVGGDTVGDYSKPRFRSPFKWIGSWLDRKVFRKPEHDALLKRNEVANIALIEAWDGSIGSRHV